MFEVRIHGRGGQGVVTAAELLAAAAFEEGLYAQAFPSFGSERTGAPVVAFCRIDDQPIRSREPVMHPDALIIQDPTLLHQVSVFEGAGRETLLLINSARLPDLGIEDFTGQLTAGRRRPGRPRNWPRRHLHRPVPNAALLGGFAALSGLVSLESVLAAIAGRFPAAIAEGNAAAARAAYDHHGAERPLGPPGARRPAARVPGRPAAGRGPPQIEGSRAVAEAVAVPGRRSSAPTRSRRRPISSRRSAGTVKGRRAARCEFVNVESEFAAMSVAIGATAVGARAYTATASQGLLYMAEALYNVSGLGLPIVMTVANRAIGAPINIWNDHSDAMSQRDCGWIQLYAQTNQEALNLHIQAFRIAEQVSLPVMVCMDGFILTHASERLEIPAQAQVDAFLPPTSRGRCSNRPGRCRSARWSARRHSPRSGTWPTRARSRPLALIPPMAAEFACGFGRDSGGLVRPYRTEDAETIVVALGSVLGTIQDTVDEMRDEGIRIGALGITWFRPFPLDAVRAALAGAIASSFWRRHWPSGSAASSARTCGWPWHGLPLRGNTVIARLGGRAITRASLRGGLRGAAGPSWSR